jgi:hypothetical protein
MSKKKTKRVRAERPALEQSTPIEKAPAPEPELEHRREKLERQRERVEKVRRERLEREAE